MVGGGKGGGGGKKANTLSAADRARAKAKNDQLKAWRKSLAAKEAGTTARKESKETLTFVKEGHYYVSEENPEVTILMNRFWQTKAVSSEAEEVTKTGLDSKNPIVRAKELYRRASPMRYYIPRLNLNPGKITAIGEQI